jgi:two-component system chemotaxis response regulator CheB
MSANPTGSDSVKRDSRVIRVLIVDDSPLINNLFKAMLDGLPDIQVVGEATNGQDAIRMMLRLRPNVITMDIRMPQMDGLEAIRQIMSIQPTPIIVVSSSVYAADYNTAFSAIESGALTVIEKPKGLDEKDFDAVREQLITAIRTLSGVTLIPRPHKQADHPANIGPKTALLHSYVLRAVQVVAIASSTGGPPVLAKILSSLPDDFSIPILIVQHNIPAFMPAMAEWLNTRVNLAVDIAREGVQMQAGHVYIAPGDAHLYVTSERILHVEQAAPIKGYRPSATRLFKSVAAAFGNNAIGIVLTGMGDDGVDGLAEMATAGAHVMVQDEASSLIFGMPKAAIDRNLADEILSPEEIATRLTKLHHHMKHR